MKRRAGHTMVRFIDMDQERAIRAWLRRPRREKPGLTHALHWLFDAYVELEAEHDVLVTRHSEARKALGDG